MYLKRKDDVNGGVGCEGRNNMCKVKNDNELWKEDLDKEREKEEKRNYIMKKSKINENLYNYSLLDQLHEIKDEKEILLYTEEHNLKQQLEEINDDFISMSHKCHL